MLMKADPIAARGSTPSRSIYELALASICILIAGVAFGGPLLELVRRWETQEEYSHGFLIPVIVAWLIWTRRNAIVASVGQPAWFGPILVALAVAIHIVGKLSALFMLSQLGFVVALIGVALSFGGYSLLKVMFVPIVFLLFAIPMPYFIDSVLSYRLQLISSELGTSFIRLFQIPVFREGNVIDLGVYKLQVVEACSGLRYLYPLMSLGFLAAYFFQAPIWQRAVIFLSTIPITIVMNSLRIGIVGILVDNFGPQDADGFLHMFEGWIIFIACASVLVAEMSLLARISGKGFFEIFHPPIVLPTVLSGNGETSIGRWPVMGCFVLLCAGAVATYFVATRQENIPDRQAFAAFPTTLGEWHGRTLSMDKETREGLGLTDYILSDYTRKDGRPVNFYVAYYASQRSGVSPHSPSVCIPGNGWQILELVRSSYTNADGTISLPLNRVIISHGQERQLVYYWFEERGMKIANEYLSKLYLLRDAMFKNRTDGALVRLTTAIYPGETDNDAEKRLQVFLQALMPNLDAYLPSDSASKISPAMNSFKPDHS
jgi:exosortase D (VPLPA-CTERM-specific)